MHHRPEFHDLDFQHICAAYLDAAGMVNLAVFDDSGGIGKTIRINRCSMSLTPHQIAVVFAAICDEPDGSVSVNYMVSEVQSLLVPVPRIGNEDLERLLSMLHHKAASPHGYLN